MALAGQTRQSIVGVHAVLSNTNNEFLNCINKPPTNTDDWNLFCKSILSKYNKIESTLSSLITTTSTDNSDVSIETTLVVTDSTINLLLNEIHNELKSNDNNINDNCNGNTTSDIYYVNTDRAKKIDTTSTDWNQLVSC